MPVNQRQYDQLTEMGISLWQNKAACFNKTSTKNSNNDKQEALYVSQDSLSLAALTKQIIFTDILKTLGISIGEITANKDHLDLGLFNWYFTTKNHEQPSIYCISNNLFSPNITSISQSSDLKKQLWLTLIKHLI